MANVVKMLTNKPYCKVLPKTLFKYHTKIKSYCGQKKIVRVNRYSLLEQRQKFMH